MQNISRRGVIVSALGAMLAACAKTQFTSEPPIDASEAYGLGGLKPLDLSVDNLIKITVCTRPFRAAGPRLEAETSGGKTVVHNYGHGGAGWSLAWGYAEDARDLVAAGRPKSVAVLGAGAIGLTTAIAIAETGADVTIFARDLPMESRSARATGVWSPSSRIGFKSAVDPDFPARWADLARRSYARHLRYVGRAGDPVEFTPRYYIRSQAPEPSLADLPMGGDDFLHLGRTLGGLAPPWRERHSYPFPSEAGVRGGLVMTFNIAEYTHQLMDDFLAMGGQIVRADIASRVDLARLPGDVVVNCAGYGAKTLLDDASLVPVRGQIAWLAPQTDRRYGVFHRNVTALSRRDGLLIQESGGNDYFGFGDDSETPNRDEFLAAQTKVAPMFNWG
ncbi:MAG: FAD-dependent oxidoreductase [Pseudomonadota bacterium]